MSGDSNRMETLSRRRLFRLGAAAGGAATAAMVLAACGESTPGDGKMADEMSAEREILDISFWDFETRPLGVAAQDAWFARAGIVADVRMNREVVPFRETEPKILAAKATGTLPDMVWSQPDSTWSWAGQEIVAPATDALDLMGRDIFGENDLNATNLDGTNFGVPQFLWPHILYYRSDLYAANGLPAPTTWDAIVSNAQALNNPPEIYGYFTYLADAHPKLAWSLMPAHDAYVFDENGNNSVNSEGTIAALKLAKAWTMSRPRARPPATRAPVDRSSFAARRPTWCRRRRSPAPSWPTSRRCWSRFPPSRSRAWPGRAPGWRA